MDSRDYIVCIDGNDKVYKEYLNTKIYHKTIRGFDMFIYKHKNNNWVCTDAITGACIDNVIFGHRIKKEAFESAIKFYSRYTDDQIKRAHENALKWIKLGKVSYKNV